MLSVRLSVPTSAPFRGRPIGRKDVTIPCQVVSYNVDHKWDRHTYNVELLENGAGFKAGHVLRHVPEDNVE